MQIPSFVFIKKEKKVELDFYHYIHTLQVSLNKICPKRWFQDLLGYNIKDIQTAWTGLLSQDSCHRSVRTVPTVSIVVTELDRKTQKVMTRKPNRTAQYSQDRDNG
jgi:hypothetical protein